jgi:hypothetical protein
MHDRDFTDPFMVGDCQSSTLSADFDYRDSSTPSRKSAAPSINSALIAVCLRPPMIRRVLRTFVLNFNVA